MLDLSSHVKIEWFSQQLAWIHVWCQRPHEGHKVTVCNFFPCPYIIITVFHYSIMYPPHVRLALWRVKMVIHAHSQRVVWGPFQHWAFRPFVITMKTGLTKFHGVRKLPGKLHKSLNHKSNIVHCGVLPVWKPRTNCEAVVSEVMTVKISSKVTALALHYQPWHWTFNMGIVASFHIYTMYLE